jgi:hypothetical protein
MAPTIQQIITANRLRDGDVVYWRAGGWVEAFDKADVFSTEDAAEAALAAARKFVAENFVVNPYLFDVRADADGVHPVKVREIVRAAGPTVRGDLGKQAMNLYPPLEGGSNDRRSFGEGLAAITPHRKVRLADFSASPSRGEAIGGDDVSI